MNGLFDPNDFGNPEPTPGFSVVKRTFAWQQCPVCMGSGLDPHHRGVNTSATCPVCDGKRIINAATGLPPNFKTQKK